MQEQLQINKDLTQKIVTISDDEHETPEESETVPDFVNEVEPITDSVNPWMRSRIPQEEPEISCITPDKPQTSEEEEEKEERNEEEELLADFQRRRMLRQTEDEDLIPTAAEEQSTRANRTLNYAIVYSHEFRMNKRILLYNE